jgi:tRNA dimethylallyltransferase
MKWSAASAGMVDPMDEVIVVTGATATGKTRLAVELALAIGGEVISMDSRQVYRGMDIGTAKPDVEERRGVRHHGFDRVDPDERYSAGRFAREARAWIAGVASRGHVPILAGGTGFYLRALTHPMFHEPALDPDRRDELRAQAEDMETEDLRSWVAEVEGLTDLGEWGGGGRQRLLRRLEVALLTGRPLSWWHENAPPEEPPLRVRVFVLEQDRPSLFERIDVRVTDMVRRGLIEEVRSLLGRGYTIRDPGMNATGYAEFIPHIEGARSVNEAVGLTRQATRKYARRQQTWFRNQLEGSAVRLDAASEATELRDRVIDYLEGASN